MERKIKKKKRKGEREKIKRRKGEDREVRMAEYMREKPVTKKR